MSDISNEIKKYAKRCSENPIPRFIFTETTFVETCKPYYTYKDRQLERSLLFDFVRYVPLLAESGIPKNEIQNYIDLFSENSFIYQSRERLDKLGLGVIFELCTLPLNHPTPIKPEDFVKTLEFMLNALRLQKPISYSLFETRTGLPISTIQKTLQQAASHDLLILTNNHFQPSSKGYHFLNDLLEFFL